MDFHSLFYGLPDLIWDELHQKVEDLFFEQEIGQQILGLYFTGPRIYGLENESPNILCIYSEIPSSLLNPIEPKASAETYRLNNSGTSVLFLSVYDFVKSVWNLESNYFNSDYLALIPHLGVSLSSEQNINKIAYYINSGLLKLNYMVSPPAINANYLCYENLTWRRDYAFIRTQYLLSTEFIFAPCLNPDWEAVTELGIHTPDPIKELDLEIRNWFILAEDLDSTKKEVLELIRSFFLRRLVDIYLTSEFHLVKEDITEAAKVVEELYRFQL